MTSVERRFTVTAPAPVVLEYLSDFGTTEQWDPATRRTVRLDSGPIEPGATWRNTSEVFGHTSDLTYTYHVDLDLHGLAPLAAPVMKLEFEKLAHDTEKRMIEVLDALGDGR